MHVFADIAQGNHQFAEVMFLIAAVLAGLGAGILFMKNSVEMALVATAIALIAVGYFVL